MSNSVTHTKRPVAKSPTPLTGILQRKCDCGNHTVVGGECAQCENKNRLQHKLIIGASNDPLEQEADRVADHVLSIPILSTVMHATPRIQHLTGPVTGDATIVPASVDRVLASAGRPLESSIQKNMSQRFGYDFSDVQVHTGADAVQSARGVNAKAYTVGRNIVFGHGQYAPGTAVGNRLLAHELTHVVQQSRTITQVTPALDQPDSTSEMDAHKIATDGITGQSFIVAPFALRSSTKLLSSNQRGISERDANTIASRTAPQRNIIPTQYNNMRPVAQRLFLQRDKDDSNKADGPLIPIPVFDEFDPAIIVPDIPGLPGFVKGQKVALSMLKKALDFLRAKTKKNTESDNICALMPGMEAPTLGKFVGKCCVKFRRDEDHCCTWRNLSLMDGRCCTKDEVLLPSNKCFKPQQAPLQPDPTSRTKPPLVTPAPTPFPRLELKIPRVRYGTIESTTLDRFAVDSDAVPALHSDGLDHIAELLKIYKDADIHVEGHTDISFTEAHNQKLSEKRAEAVKRALVKRGVIGSRVKTKGFGEEQLLFPKESNGGEKAGNRRVEIWFYIPPSKTMAEELMLQP